LPALNSLLQLGASRLEAAMPSKHRRARADGAAPNTKLYERPRHAIPLPPERLLERPAVFDPATPGG
jgi:hypothetical protein